MVSPLEPFALLVNLFHTLIVFSGSILLQDAGPKQEPVILRQKSCFDRVGWLAAPLVSLSLFTVEQGGSDGTTL
jgi:hypothetical protein